MKSRALGPRQDPFFPSCRTHCQVAARKDELLLQAKSKSYLPSGTWQAYRSTGGATTRVLVPLGYAERRKQRPKGHCFLMSFCITGGSLGPSKLSLALPLLLVHDFLRESHKPASGIRQRLSRYSRLPPEVRKQRPKGHCFLMYLVWQRLYVPLRAVSGPGGQGTNAFCKQKAILPLTYPGPASE